MRTAIKKKVLAKSVKLASNKTIVKKATSSKAVKPTPKSTIEKPKPQATTHSATSVPLTPKTPNKQSQLIALLKDPKGSNIQELIQATGWQAHSVRGVISGVIRKRLGLMVISQKIDGVQRYRIEAA